MVRWGRIVVDRVDLRMGAASKLTAISVHADSEYMAIRMSGGGQGAYESCRNRVEGLLGLGEKGTVGIS